METGATWHLEFMTPIPMYNTQDYNEINNALNNTSLNYFFPKGMAIIGETENKSKDLYEMDSLADGSVHTWYANNSEEESIDKKSKEEYDDGLENVVYYMHNHYNEVIGNNHDYENQTHYTIKNDYNRFRA